MPLPPLHIHYQDSRLVVVEKPSGWLVHRSNIDRHEHRILVQALRDQIGQRVHPAHRLDKGTSGLLLCALDPDAARQLGQQFAQQQVSKTYLAVVRGWPPPAGRIDHPLTEEADAYEDSCDDNSAAANVAFAASTEFRRLATVELDVAVDRYPKSRYALVELHPLTGRRHQLRRHMKHIAHPIIGDATHGKGIHNRFFQRQFDSHRLLLACTALTFSHPDTGQPLKIAAPPDTSFTKVLGALGWSALSEMAERA